jgi:hypothetical protein
VEDKNRDFLKLLNERFLKLRKKIMDDKFLLINEDIRFSIIKEVLIVYSELLEGKRIKGLIKDKKSCKEDKDDLFEYDFFIFIRNLLIHFPLYDNWDEVCFWESMINWSSEGRRIDKFLKTNQEDININISRKDKSKKCFNIYLNQKYLVNQKICLKDIINEKDAVIFLRWIIEDLMLTENKLDRKFLLEEQNLYEEKVKNLKEEIKQKQEELIDICNQCEKKCIYNKKI